MYEIISYNKEKVGIKMTSSKSYVCGLPVCRSNGIKKNRETNSQLRDTKSYDQETKYGNV